MNSAMFAFAPRSWFDKLTTNGSECERNVVIARSTQCDVATQERA
jgi:hypothetical protein